MTDRAGRPILLVEDNPLDVDLTLRAFERRKLSNPIDVARDGEEALARIPLWEQGAPIPLVILLDLQLPRVDGLEVMRRYKAHPLIAQVPIIALTTSNEDRDIQTAYAQGVNSYIVKPVDFTKFLDVAAQIELYWVVLNEPPRPSDPR
jgi:hypothetical protein